MRASRRRRTAVTLLELLVVIGILAVLLALLVPAVQRARAAAARAECGNNLRQLGLALHGYHGSHKLLPPGVRGFDDRYPFLAWSARLLPYLEQDGLWRQTEQDYAIQRRFNEPPRQHVGLATVLPVFICPADGRTQGRVVPNGPTAAFTHYLGVIGSRTNAQDGVLYDNSRIGFRHVTDGSSNTLMVGERPPSPDSQFGWWYAGVGQDGDGDADMVLAAITKRITFRHPTCDPGPYYYGPGSASNLCDTYHFWSQHDGGANFLFVDGSVRFLDYTAQPVLPALASRAGGEKVEY